MAVLTTRLEVAFDKLKATGVRMTPQRHAILSYLLDSLEHPSVDDIYKALEARFPHMSVATVYNNLKVFLEADLVRELTYGDRASRYDAMMSDHYHAICEDCGRIEDFEISPLYEIERAAEKATGFMINSHRMEVYGLCSSCAKVVQN